MTKDGIAVCSYAKFTQDRHRRYTVTEQDYIKLIILLLELCFGAVLQLHESIRQ